MTDPRVREGSRFVELIVLPAVRTVDAESGCLVLAHDQSGLSTAAVPGEEVVLLDGDGEFHAGVVVALSVRDGRLHYSVRQGVRLPSEAAHERLRTPADPADRAAAPQRGVSDQSLLDLLGELRDPDRDL